MGDNRSAALYNLYANTSYVMVEKKERQIKFSYKRTKYVADVQMEKCYAWKAFTVTRVLINSRVSDVTEFITHMVGKKIHFGNI